MGFALFLPLLFYQQINSVHAVLPPPENLTLHTLNTQYILRWDWDQSTTKNHSVSFTAEFLAKYKLSRKKQDWNQVCISTQHTGCDLTGADLHYMGIYVLRVRANAGKLHSQWVSKEFCPDKEAALGPPSRVDLATANTLLEVAISDPLTSNRASMKINVPFMYYRIHYWRRSTDPQGKLPQSLDSTANLVTLPDLEPWTWYCVRVQSRYNYYNKTSNFTQPHCMETEGPTPIWQIAIGFLASLAGCFVVVLLSSYGSFRAYRLLKGSFYPNIQLPPHFQKYFCDRSPGSDVPQLLQPERESELYFDRLSVGSELVLLEIHTPPPEAATEASGAEQDSSRHSRQDSRDSGVYSTEEGSGETLLLGRQGIQPGQESWKRAPVFASEQVNMEEMRPVPGCGGSVDEGLLDMCV